MRAHAFGCEPNRRGAKVVIYQKLPRRPPRTTPNEDDYLGCPACAWRASPTSESQYPVPPVLSQDYPDIGRQPDLNPAAGPLTPYRVRGGRRAASATLVPLFWRIKAGETSFLSDPVLSAQVRFILFNSKPSCSTTVPGGRSRPGLGGSPVRQGLQTYAQRRFRRGSFDLGDAARDYPLKPGVACFRRPEPGQRSCSRRWPLYVRRTDNVTIPSRLRPGDL